jgi:ergothioneine biosynthesis protein EgtB
MTISPPETQAGDASDLRARFLRTRAESEALALPLSSEDQTVQTMPDVSPTKWHLAHTTWFFDTFILEAFEPGYRAFHPAYRYLFNSYYNGVGPQFFRPHRGNLSRPGVAEIRAYRSQITERVASLMEAWGAAAPAEALSLIELGINHEQQHQELILTDIKHVLGINPLHPVYQAPAGLRAVEDAPELRWRGFEGGLAETGHEGAGFIFDNEGPRHRVWLPPFALASRPVTCGEYLEFMEDGGYRRPELWLSAGWATVQERGWQAPLYWQRDGEHWGLYTLGGFRRVIGSEVLSHVSFFEAAAFAKWAGKRLPTEFEWEHAATGEAIEGNFADSRLFHPARAAERMFGDVWRWTASAYLPYPGYREVDGPVGEYNGKFMASQTVLRGGSAATPAGHVRATYRNFFPPDARWQFSGLVLAEDRP